jgi:hypothetical protein
MVPVGGNERRRSWKVICWGNGNRIGITLGRMPEDKLKIERRIPGIPK